MEWAQYVIPIATGCAGIVTGIRDIKKDKKAETSSRNRQFRKFRKVKWYKKFKWYTIFLISVAIISTVFDMYTKRSDANETDSRQKDLLGAISKESEGLSHKLDRIKEKPEMRIELVFMPMPGSDSVKTLIYPRNSGAPAYNCKIKGFMIFQKGGVFTRTEGGFSYELDESKVVTKDSLNPILKGRFCIDKRLYDTLFFNLVLTYTDEEGNKGRDVRRIFQFTGKEFNTLLQPADSKNFRQIKDYLIGIGRW